MFKLRTGYLITGIVTGCIILFSFLGTIPDGKLHVVFCNVGQGDAAYIRFPDGRDMVVDGGPDDKILGCLGRHMPFWDRSIDIVLMTHPQKDHMQGLIAVLERYGVSYFIRSDVDNTTEGYQKLLDVLKQKKVAVKFATAGERITIGSATVSMIWPSEEQIAQGKVGLATRASPATQGGDTNDGKILGVTSGELNDYSLVFDLQYGTFDVLFTGDADNHVNKNFVGNQALDVLEVLKVPHHGSKTGMTEAFLDWVRPELAVISVGKNSYGHPHEATLATLATRGIKIMRTDKEGDVEVVSDGRSWSVKTGKKL